MNLLKTVKKLIKTNNLQEIAVNILNKNKTKNSTYFYVNKQAMYHNNYHMIDEDMSVLGDIKVDIQSNDINGIINWILE